ncbi:GNAT family N-acetyltransferase [uncultured Shimia sp.]|uniref:GNAT family N-acetyltransferase n=1 Tax=uncultured Shimia sp. TaxID=573152 RepID=UPI0025FD1228|nr:GNAT family N-acetyltransferase [uncultured Shimia sp.]
MAVIRQATQADQERLYEVVVQTGKAGNDATPLYDDPKMLGHIYTAPYVVLAPDLAFVVEINGQVEGYVCGVEDSRVFEAQLEAAWWPALQAQYPAPDAARRATWSEDERRADWIHNAVPTPDYVVQPYPAHMHMNLMPAARGGGLGRRLFDTWLQAAQARGVGPVHIGADPKNDGGIAFWQAMGFERLRQPDGTFSTTSVWMGRP